MEDEKIIENLDEDEQDSDVLEKYQISSYGADYPVDGLIKRYLDGSIAIPPFQRGYVWSLNKASRFIESLLLGLPVPGIFLYREEGTNRLIVIDGNQRLTTLLYYYQGIFKPVGREFCLTGINSEFKGKTYQLLPIEDKRTLDNSILHATIVKQEKPSDNLSSVFHIFERLNTGGQPLQDQEIRTAIYSGDFNTLLKTLNSNEHWRSLYGGISSRMRDQELILRFFALFYWEEKYSKPMRVFLNRYMYHNKQLKMQNEKELTDLFVNTVSTIDKILGKTAFSPRESLVAATYDAVIVGVARRLQKGSITDNEGIIQAHSALMANQSFIDAVETHTSDADKVHTRLKLSSEYFMGIK